MIKLGGLVSRNPFVKEEPKKEVTINEASGADSAYICTFTLEKGQFVYTRKALLNWLDNSDAAAGSVRRILTGPLNKTLSNGKDWSDENLDHLETVTRVTFTQ